MHGGNLPFPPLSPNHTFAEKYQAGMFKISQATLDPHHISILSSRVGEDYLWEIDFASLPLRSETTKWAEM